MPNDFETILANMTGASNSTQSTGGQSTAQSSALVKVLTDRLSQQGEGIASSSSSNLLASLEGAIGSTQEAGRLSSEAMQIERGREVDFARGQGQSDISSAMSGRRGYNMQVIALRELTGTTEKSIRDLDDRYKQAILSNDAATAQRVSDLQMQKQTFLMEQEQNFYNNMFQAANLEQAQIGQQMQSEQFWAGQEAQEQQFMLGMKQSQDQFKKNLGLQYEQLSLDQQQVNIARDRQDLSLKEYNERTARINEDRKLTATKAMIQSHFENLQRDGVDMRAFDPLTVVDDLMVATGYDGDSELFMSAIWESYNSIDVSDIPPVIPGSVGGVFGTGGLAAPIGRGYTAATSVFMEALMGTPVGQESAWSKYGPGGSQVK